MKREEKLLLLRGFSGGFVGGRSKDPLIGPMQRMTSGYVPGIPRLGIPALHVNDASIGVANGFNANPVRPGDEATAMPSMIALSASFEPRLAFEQGRSIAEEFRARGMNMVLGPGLNLARDARGGRNFEYLGGEDPLLAGTLAGNAAKGIQSVGVMSNLKHYALHDQTADSSNVNAEIDEKALRESDLLAFEIAVEIGHPASMMCAYNFLNGVRACHNDFLNNVVLKTQWGWKGFVLSDWGAVHDTVGAALGGLDQESAWTFDHLTPYFGPDALNAGIDSGQIPMSRIDDMTRRILWGIVSSGVYDDPPKIGQTSTAARAEHLAVARHIAERGMVLLKNENNILPLKAEGSIALIGGRADLGVLTGGGSSAVVAYGGILKPDGSGNPFDPGPKPTQTPDGHPILPAPDFGGQGLYITAASPLAALRQAMSSTAVTFQPGVDLNAAAEAARKAKVAIVLVNQINAEGEDPASIQLPGDQDALVDAVATANPNTIVLVQSGNAILMPWLRKVRAVLVVWYSGQDGGTAISNVLLGKVAPSGRLPVTFPQSNEQQPRPTWPGSDQPRIVRSGPRPAPPAPADLIDPGGRGLNAPLPDKPKVTYDYNIEGSDVGYRWFVRKGYQPLFSFGFGLSYTTFRYTNLRVIATKTISATFTVINTGSREGADVPQLYVSLPGAKHSVRLGGWQKVDLKPGERREVTVTVEPRILAEYVPPLQRWRIQSGKYRVEVSTSAVTPKLHTEVMLTEQLLLP